MKKTALILATLTVFAVPSLAQDSNKQSGDQGAVQATSTQPTYAGEQKASDFRASKILGLKVHGNDDKEIGEIEDLIVSPGDKVSYVIIEVGGFLGIGEKDVAVPADALSIIRDGSSVRASLNASKDELKQAPTYKYYSAK